jgi:hypothetical protein
MLRTTSALDSRMANSLAFDGAQTIVSLTVYSFSM